MADRAAQVLTTLVVSGLLARGIGIEAYGQWQLAMSLLFLLATLANAASSDIVVPQVVAAGKAGREVIVAALRLRLGLSLAAMGLGCLVALAWPGGPLPLLLLLLPILLREPVMAVMAWFVAQGDPRPYALISLTSLVIRLAATWAVFLAELSTYWYVLPLVLENLFFIGALLLRAQRDGIHLLRPAEPRQLLGLLRTSSWGWLALIATLATLRVDRLLLALWLTPEQLGAYAAAAQINDNWYYLGLVLAAGLGPLLVHRARDEAVLGNLRWLLGGALLACLLAAGAICLLAPQLILLVFGHAFDEAAQILRITTWPAILIPLDLLMALPILRLRAVRWLALKNLLVLALVLALIPLLYPSVGLYAPASALAIAYLSSLGATVLKLRAAGAGRFRSSAIE